uniref:Pericentrin/AKAP-450 centrosomal targeting domain-containing protein n=1 Tax=Podarcis muralis TaxID=64176 RepID=A0A670HWL9_PODMU
MIGLEFQLEEIHMVCIFRACLELFNDHLLKRLALHNLKLEALRLSSNNTHTSQLELVQTNLRKEKETALMELREMLNDKHAQEVAVLQGQYHFELERIKEQSDKEKEEMDTVWQFSMLDFIFFQNLKRGCASNTDLTFKNLHEELSVKYQIELNEMKRTLNAETEEVKRMLKSLSLEKEQVESRYYILRRVIIIAIYRIFRSITQKLMAMQEKLKAESEEEIKQLWSQLDSARASRQELSELKEQLLARTSHMEEMEYLKKDFQLKWDKKKSEHENELEQLRLYFEQKLKSVEENYREELTMLHQRLREMKDYSLLEVENSQDLHAEFGSSAIFSEEMTEKERHDLFEQLTQQLERHKEELSCVRLHLDDKHRSEVELLRSSLTLQYEENLKKMKMDLSDRFTSEMEQLKRKHSLSLEQLRAKMSEEHLREIAKLGLQSAQDAARQVEMEVAERCLALENEYKAKLCVLQVETQKEDVEELRRENTKLKEISVCQEMHWKEELEQIKCKLIEDHANELRKAREELQEMEQTHKTKAEEWKREQEESRRKAEEKLSLLRKELESKAECEKRALQKQSEFREAEMIWLQQQQAARIVELEKSLKEQQNSVRQLEDTLVNAQKTLAQYDSELTSTKTLMTEELEKAQEVLQEEWKAKLKDAQSRLVEEHEAITKKITREHEILFQELREKHTEELNLQRTELQHKHKEHISSLTSILQTKHQADTETLKSVFERKQQALETQIADMQNNHQAQITELETKHLSNLDSLESTYISEIQLLQDEHRQAIEDLWVDFRDQLLQKDKENQMFLAQVDEMKLQHVEELQICQDNLKIELTTVHMGKLKTMAAELEEAQNEDLAVVLGKQRLLKDDYHNALDVQREEILHIEEQHKKAIQELQDIHLVEVNQEKENCQHLQKEVKQQVRQTTSEDLSLLHFLQMEEKVKFLELEDADAELRNLQHRDRENQEGETLMALLRSDMDFCTNERKKLQESYQHALKLLLKMVKATKDTEDLIYKKIGLCLDESLASGDSGESRSIIGEIVLAQNRKTVEKWGIEKSSREHSFDSSLPDEVSELSEHLCESIFENPNLVFENEERIHKICHCLHIAVEKLLELVAESSKQLEETQKTNIHYEEELKRRNWEASQVVHERQKLMECLNEESEAKNNLVLELHKARGLIEGYLTERHTLEEALKLKEESECHLVAELENLKEKLQELTQEHARSLEEQKLLITKAKLELQCQVEKDCSTLNSQMKILEMELEEQLNKNQKITALSLEVTDLRQQIQALERQLKNQRDFMDKQAVEREHERDEFQEEIHKLEMQLKVTRKSQTSEQSRVYEVETLLNEIKEKTEDYNMLFLDKEQIQKNLAVQKEEIEKLESRVRELEFMNREETENVNKLTQELQKKEKKEAELKQDKEALQQQQYDNLIQISTLQSKLDEIRHRVPREDSLDHTLMEQLKTQEELLSKNRNVILRIKTTRAIESNPLPSRKHHQSTPDIWLSSLCLKTSKEGDSTTLLGSKFHCRTFYEIIIFPSQVLEIEDLKSVIEHLHDDKEQLLKDKTEEIEQLYKVIEKLQNELTLHEIRDSPDSLNNVALVEQEENLHNKLKEGSPHHLESRDESDSCLLLNSSQKQILEQLESLLADRETWQQLLEEKECQFQSSRHHFTELAALQLQYKELQEEHKLLNMCLAQKESDMTVTASCIQELKDKLRDSEIKLTETEKQFQAVSEQKTELVVEVENIRGKVLLLENERHVLAQKLHDKEVTYQREISELQTAAAELKSQIEKITEELETVRSEKDFFHSQLKSYREKGQDNHNKKLKLGELVPEPVPYVSSEEIEEGGEEREPNNKPSGSMEFSYRDEMVCANHNIINTQIMVEINNQDIKMIFQQMLQLNHVFQSTQFSQKISENFESRVIDKTSWDSPEMMRKQNNSMELQISLPLTPFSEVDGMHSTGSASLSSDSSVLQGDIAGLLECPISYSNGSEEMAAYLLQSQHSINARLEDVTVRWICSWLTDQTLVILTFLPFCFSDTSSDLVLQLNQEDPETILHQDSKIMTYLQCFGIVPDITEPARKERDVFSQQLKNVLKMVSEESYKILVLSEKSLPHNDKKNVQKSPSKEGWQKESLALLDTVQSLKDYLNKVPDKEDKEQQQKLVLEHLLSSDRNSLLTEIQDLEAELRLMHLQSQEKLQQLQETLINTENHQSKQEHQLRRQVELLEYKLQQEKSIASDLQASLKSEQEKSSEMHELLKQEHSAISNLKSDLCESKQTNERLQKSLQDLQEDIVKYSSALENKEKDMTAVLQDFQNEQVKEKELQHMLDEQQHQHKLKEEEKSKAIEELQAALELQCIQNNQLSVALEHEQSANSNLRKELEIEHSRCEALLSQYKNKLLELQKSEDVEKNRSLELLSALKHERILTEQLSMRINECGSCKHNDSLQELKAQLYKERSHARNLLAIIEKTRQQVLDSKKQMGEMQIPSEQPPKEQELHTTLQAAQTALQSQKEDIIHALKIQTEKDIQMRKKWDQLQSILRLLREQERGTEQRRREIKQEQQTEFGKLQELQEAGESLVRTRGFFLLFSALIKPTCVINSMQESEGTAYQEEKPILHNGLRTTEHEETKTNVVAENKSAMSSSNLKMQKLYRKYLRAESFRKALVYQKKYLLLLLGGFQECEQATLSLIARMGIYPSPDLTVCELRSRSFTKFRSAIRVVIAISRLKFLVKKWHKVGRKEMPSESVSPGVRHNSCENSRRILWIDYKLLLVYISLCRTSSKDPEHSLTEYIAHLEAIQQRLGIIMPGKVGGAKCPRFQQLVPAP